LNFASGTFLARNFVNGVDEDIANRALLGLGYLSFDCFEIGHDVRECLTEGFYAFQDSAVDHLFHHLEASVDPSNSLCHNKKPPH
jgi:hypothetical protein